MSEVYNKIISKLQKLKEYQKILKEIQKVNKQKFVDDYHFYGLAERYLQLAIEVVLDISKLVINAKSFCRPESNQEMFEILAKEKVIGGKLRDVLFGIANFRNILVHDYEKIDRGIVYEILQSRIDDFESFGKAVKRYLKKV
ncbi:MAG: DUF86 domain-containing protein [bacterium]